MGHRAARALGVADPVKRRPLARGKGADALDFLAFDEFVELDAEGLFECSGAGVGAVAFVADTDGGKFIGAPFEGAFEVDGLLLGAEVVPVESGSKTLKDALNEAMRDWVTNVEDTFYLIGTVAGPHPYPAMVRDFQSIIGKETREQLQAQEGRLPDSLVACIGGGSNAMGLFHEFLEEPSVQIIGVEAGGHGVHTDKHAASLNGGVPGVLHGNRTYLLQDQDGQITDAHSISAGLDYPGIGPEHAYLHEVKRVEYVSITDDEALDAFHATCRLEGIIPALESSHALAEAIKRAPKLPKDHLMVVCLSGRGDKDMQTVMNHMAAQEKQA